MKQNKAEQNVKYHSDHSFKGYYLWKFVFFFMYTHWVAMSNMHLQRFREVNSLFIGLKADNRMSWDLRVVLPGSKVPCCFHRIELSLLHFSTHFGDNNRNQELTNLSLFPTAAASSEPYFHLCQRGCLLVLAVYKESGEENDS